MAAGGFRPSLVETSDGVTEEASFLASEHRMAKRSGITVDASKVSADGNGDKIVKAGTFMALVDATGKYMPYDNTKAADAGGTAAGLLWESINVRDGDVVCGLLIHGSVLQARVTGLDVSSDAMGDLAGRIIFQ